MNDIEKCAHDFAIAAVNAYQAVQNTKDRIQDRTPKYDVNELLDVYLKAFNALEVELCEKQYQSEL